jgi:hypothetical protein
VVEVAGLEVTLKGEAESFLNQKVRELAPRFDAAANEGLHVRNAAEGAWLSLREPVRIGESPDLWLSAAPVAIAASPLEISRDRVLLRTSLRARLLLTAGTRPEPSPLRALPPLRVLPPGDPTLRVHLPVLLTHRAVAERLKTEAVGRSLDLGGAVLEVRDARVYGSGGRLILGLDIRTSAGTGAFAPSAAGTIYLGGRPKLDPKRQVLSVEDVSFDLPTKGILAEAASWLLTPVLAGAIQSALVFPLDGAIRDAKAQIERFLRGTRIGGGFFLSGTLKELRLDSLRVRKEGTEALAAVTGVLSLDWRPARGGGSP